MKNLANTPLSILDLAKVPEGQSLAQTFKHSKELAQHVERLGFLRFWLAEHHNLEGIASAATSILIGYIAENTTSLRVGSGGIMLPNHAPLVIAEQFGTLATLYPDRIDLGLGRAPGTDRPTMRALRRDLIDKGTDFGEMVQELQFYFEPAEPNQEVKAIPGAGLDVPLFILGSSLYGAELAARLGRPFAFAGHFAPRLLMHAFQIYRSNFTPSRHLKRPYAILTLPVIAAENDARAKFLATSLQQAFLGIIRGHRKLNRPPVDDIDVLWNLREKQMVNEMLSLLITGGPTKVRHELDVIIERTGADELMVTSDTFEHSDRLRSLEILAQAKSLI